MIDWNLPAPRSVKVFFGVMYLFAGCMLIYLGFIMSNWRAVVFVLAGSFTLPAGYRHLSKDRKNKLDKAKIS